MGYSNASLSSSSCHKLSRVEYNYPFIASFNMSCTRGSDSYNRPPVPFDSVLFTSYSNSSNCSSAVLQYQALPTGRCLSMSSNTSAAVFVRFTPILAGSIGYKQSYYSSASCSTSTLFKEIIVDNVICQQNGTAILSKYESESVEGYNSSYFDWNVVINEQFYSRKSFSPANSLDALQGFFAIESFTSKKCVANQITSLTSDGLGVCLTNKSSLTSTSPLTSYRYVSHLSNCSDLRLYRYNDSTCGTLAQAFDVFSNGAAAVDICTPVSGKMESFRYSCSRSTALTFAVSGVVFEEYLGQNSSKCTGEVKAFSVSPTGVCNAGLGNIFITASSSEFIVKKFSDFRCQTTPLYTVNQSYLCGKFRRGDLLYSGVGSDGISYSLTSFVSSPTNMPSMTPTASPFYGAVSVTSRTIQLLVSQTLWGVSLASYQLQSASFQEAWQYTVWTVFQDNNGNSPVQPGDVSINTVSSAYPLTRRLVSSTRTAPTAAAVAIEHWFLRSLATAEGLVVTYLISATTTNSSLSFDSLRNTLSTAVTNHDFLDILLAYAGYLNVTALLASSSTIRATNITFVDTSPVSFPADNPISNAAFIGIAIGAAFILFLLIMGFVHMNSNSYNRVYSAG